MHHGAVSVNETLKAGIVEVDTWLASHPDELVLMLISDCEGGDACRQAVSSVLAAANLTRSECSVVARRTVSAVREMAQRPRGGALVIVGAECVNENYDPTIECFGFASSDGDNGGDDDDGDSDVHHDANVDAFKNYFNCHGENKQVPWQRLWTDLVARTANPPDAGVDMLSMAQGHWQYSVCTPLSFARSSGPSRPA